MASVKVLLGGECDGGMGALFKKAAAANKKSGPFNALVCIGSGEHRADATASASTSAPTRPAPPVPTYVLGEAPPGDAAEGGAHEAAEGSPSIHYLGRAGVTRICGLTVAFLLSSEAGSTLDPDVAALKRAVDALEGEVDLLLTDQWPQGITFGTPPAALPEPLQALGAVLLHSMGSPVVTDVASWVRPRYHIAGGQQVFYGRAPYLNRDLGAGVRATRFVGLAPVSNATKQKSLHALALVPATHMSVEQLEQRPDGCTLSPFDAAAASRKRGQAAAEEGDAQADWRWDMRGKKARVNAAVAWGNPLIPKDNARSVFVRNLPFAAAYADVEATFSFAGTVVDIRRPLNDSGRLQGWAHVQFESADMLPRALELNGTTMMGRELFVDSVTTRVAPAVNIGKPVEDCWFCLSGSNVDASLIVSIGEECYVALDKGAICGEHVLVVPIEHYPSTVSLPASSFSELQRYLSGLRTYYSSIGKQLVGFERFLNFRARGGNHSHLNIVAVPTDAAAAAQAAFTDAVAGAMGADLVHVPAAAAAAMSQEALREVVGDGEYFLALLPDGSQLVHAIQRDARWPLNLGREVLAELCGAPDKADWKSCSYSAEALAGMVDKFKSAFSKYDIMQA